MQKVRDILRIAHKAEDARRHLLRHSDLKSQPPHALMAWKAGSGDRRRLLLNKLAAGFAASGVAPQFRFESGTQLLTGG